MQVSNSQNMKLLASCREKAAFRTDRCSLQCLRGFADLHVRSIGVKIEASQANKIFKEIDTARSGEVCSGVS